MPRYFSYSFNEIPILDDQRCGKHFENVNYVFATWCLYKIHTPSLSGSRSLSIPLSPDLSLSLSGCLSISESLYLDVKIALTATIYLPFLRQVLEFGELVIPSYEIPSCNWDCIYRLAGSPVYEWNFRQVVGLGSLSS